ncbi:MAG TPA: Ku protein [Fimbriimonadaceae bacterium]|nr:Ku protein [Fimbriimonadaceae bacterium]
MAARSIWNGTISFGMVSIPVRLSTATQEKDISFHMIHESCGSRVKLLKWCPKDERPVERDEIVKGYEYAKGHHVILKEEDFEKLPLPTKHTIEVLQFVEQQEIDPIYFDKTYYLEPEDVGKKPYALLLKALTQKNVVAIGQIALRSHESLCCLRAVDGKILLETLFYPDEIRSAPEVKADDVQVGDKELAMASSLIDMLQEPFEPGKYKDNYREALQSVIEAKLQGGEVKAVPEVEDAQVIDLMEALRASVEQAKKERAKA